MKRKGSILYDVLVGIFLMGLISASFFPIITSSFKNFNSIKNKTEMTYIAEMVAERLRTDKDLYNEILSEFETEDNIKFNDSGFDGEKYNCTIVKTKSSNRIIDVEINISTKDQEKGLNVQLKTSIPKN